VNASSTAAAPASIAATTCPAVLVSAPPASVARDTTMALPLTATDSGEDAAPGSRRSIESALPPSLPHARDVTTTREALTVPSSACALRR
jgi:hypothetical protein